MKKYIIFGPLENLFGPIVLYFIGPLNSVFRNLASNKLFQTDINRYLININLILKQARSRTGHGG